MIPSVLTSFRDLKYSWYLKTAIQNNLPKDFTEEDWKEMADLSDNIVRLFEALHIINEEQKLKEAS